jgi:alpha-2-macroglobulin
MVQKTKKRIFLGALFLFLIAMGSVFLSNKEGSRETKGRVLGEMDQKPEVYIYKNNDYERGGFLAFSSIEEPSVNVRGYNISGEAKVDIWRADSDALLSWLVHDEKNNQVSSKMDTGKFSLAGSTMHYVDSGEKDSKLVLPLEESGIWMIHLTLGSIEEKVFIVRSETGALVKEGDDELIFWAQDFSSKKSVSGAEVKVYNLLEEKKVVDSSVTGSDGVAKTALAAEADLAVVRNGSDETVVPINLKYLNSDYRYENFVKKTADKRYFVFTDRPLYRPGDTVFFKAIVRDDDDARYTIPQGPVKVEVQGQGGEEYQPIFEKEYNFSETGSVSGEFVLPKDGPTGEYYLTMTTDEDENNMSWWGQGSAYFSVEYYQKPEYGIDVSTSQNELISGDKINFKVSGEYFSGQPLSGGKVTYTVFASDFYDYDYFSDTERAIDDNYRYSYFWGEEVTKGEVGLNESGEAEVSVDSKIPDKFKGSQIFSIEAQFSDESGNPSIARKNILVRDGEYGIYRENWNWEAKVGDQVPLEVKIKSYQGSSIGNTSLQAKVKHTTWVKYQEKDQKYPSYKKEEENLPDIKAMTNTLGKTSFNFVPVKEGSYEFSVEGKDSRGNAIEKNFYIWASDSDNVYSSSGEEDKGLTIVADREKYSPGETARLKISSEIPDRDIFLSFERGRVNRYQIVHMEGKTDTVEVPLAKTDVPNIFARASSFSDQFLSKGEQEIEVSAEGKKLKVNVTPDKEKYKAGEEVTLNISTSDSAGNPVPAETAVWAVDKSIFELSENNLGDIFETFWNKRYNDTQESNSLVGITAYGAEQGGCFSEGTKVLMAGGESKNIEEVRTGEKILTRKAENDKSLVEAEVAGTHFREIDGYLNLNDKLKVSRNHLLWVNGSWKRADNIKIGDELTDKDGQAVKIFSIEWKKEKIKVHNLLIKDYHSYIAENVWVHNGKDGGAGRSVFKDTAYWNPALKTDSSGRAKISFKLPDNLTTWAIAAVGATIDTQVGKSFSEIVVSRDVIVRPILPYVLREGDKIYLSALIQNSTENDYAFKTELKFDGGDVITPQKDVFVKAKSSKQIFWEVFPKNENEKSKLTFSAVANDDEKLADIITREIPVRKFGFWETNSQAANEPVTFPVNLSAKADIKKSKINLLLSPSLVGSLPASMEYLVDYPYGCVEQTTSRFVPAIIAKKNSNLFRDSIAGKNIDEIIEKSIERLGELQQSDGGWGWWNQDVSDSFVTAYVVEYLLEAKNLGFASSENLLAMAQGFLEMDDSYFATDDQEKIFAGANKVARIYALSLLGSDSGKQRIENYGDLYSDLLAMAVMTNIRNGFTDPKTNGMDLLISSAKTEGNGVYWEGGGKNRFGSTDASTSFAVRALVAGGKNRDLAAKAVRYLESRRKGEYWSNTFATAQTIQSLVDFSKAGEELAPDYAYQVKLDGREIEKGLFNKFSQSEEISIPTDKIKPGGSQITLSGSGTGQLYSTLTVDEFNTDQDAKSQNDGLGIRREYIGEKEPGQPFAVGEEVTVRLTVNGTETPNNYAVIEDHLPAGLVPINKKLKNEQSGDVRQEIYSNWDMEGMEITEDGAVLSLGQIDPGQKKYEYKARVVSAGQFTVPPARVSLMYSPEIKGRSEVQKIEVLQKKEKGWLSDFDEKIGSLKNKMIGMYVLIGLVILAALSLVGLWAVKRAKKTENGEK